ncbi:MAG TPA: ATP-binding protein [Bradyrhizobium sp.]|uniref:ATP-binding protein n=1 Tax=Bradyrhizobium sp. TaxID=376 RepID=UPI002B49F673|nr:ATP-binding protein [Bradyrhizobium sp.]HKO72845.1 ATP-binding protein [Bradyrhizobium sp.]
MVSTSLRPNLVKRVQRLPKPTNVAGALQPLFEAISNSIHSTQAKFGDSAPRRGKIVVTVSTNRKKEDVWATVEDNGEGLNKSNWEAFTTTDTDNKIQTGGKGVGRLLWLDCFEEIEIVSVFRSGLARKKRSFRFVLALEDQIRGEKTSSVSPKTDTYFWVKFGGLKDNGYLSKFPGRESFVFQHLTSHFLPTFIGGRCPAIAVHVGDETRNYPEDIDKIVSRKSPEIPVKTAEYGTLTLTLMECEKVASADMKGSHFIHFIAHDRTVKSQCIDGKLGLKYFGEKQDRVFHALITGEYLNENVNQERTAFLFEDVVIERIINDVCTEYINKFLAEPLAELSGKQKEIIEDITESYPSVAFGDTEELQAKLPSGELNDDAIYGHLSRERFRRDQRQAEKIRSVLTRLKQTGADIRAFSDVLKEAGKAIEDAEKRSLAEYVVRRKVVLDFIEILLEKVRDDTRDSSYQREDILHSFICPLRINTLANGSTKVEAASSHDLWILDERLTFARYFSSDVEFSILSAAVQSEERPDVLIFDYVHGLRQTEEPSKVLLVEFKRPGRTSYGDDENPQLQVERYIRRLQSGILVDVKGRPIKLDSSTVFYCFIVADIMGKLNEWTYSWQRTADNRGRIYRPNSGFLGSIELVGWDALIEDARARNQAFFDYAGISGRSLFSPTGP